VREFIRTTMMRFFVDRTNYYSIKQLVDAVAETQDMNPEVAKFIYNKISEITSLQTQAFVLGYGVLGVTPLAELELEVDFCKYDEGRYGECYYAPDRDVDLVKYGHAVTSFVSYDQSVVESAFIDLASAQIAFTLGITPLGYGYLLPRESIYKLKTRLLAELQKVLGSPEFVKTVEYKQYSFMNRLTYTALGFANYQKYEEMTDYRMSVRADQWMSLQLLRYMVENIVDPVIRKRESNPFMIRQYKNAALNLVFGPVKKHAWGQDAFKIMSDEEYLNWWISKWEKYNLDRRVLVEIYEVIKKWLPHIRIMKQQLSSRIKLSRLLSASLRK